LISLYDDIKKDPVYYRQLTCGDSLISKYDCPLETKFADIWSHYNYIIYVFEGRKVWHTAHGSYDLTNDKCVLVRKGAAVVEQFLDTRFCLVMFFLPDEFICDVLRSRKTPLYKPGKKFNSIIPIENDASVKAFFQSVMHHFSGDKKPDQSLLEQKFRELILTLAENPSNSELLSYFSSLLNEPHTVSLQRIMEDNFCYNLKLEEFARLSNRSLSAFKRDFEKVFGTSPGKWLMEKRLHHSMHLLTNHKKSVSAVAFEAGFESPSHFSRAFRNFFGYTPALLKQR
jgi:AraC-like DNA-binding protein